MAAQDTSGWNEPELRGEIQRLRLREAKAKKKYDQAREEASEKEDEVGRLMEKLQDVMVSLDVSREECEGLRQQGPVETSADVNFGIPLRGRARGRQVNPRGPRRRARQGQGVPRQGQGQDSGPRGQARGIEGRIQRQRRRTGSIDIGILRTDG